MKKQQLHIAMLGHKHIPSREGGVEIVVEELSTRMAALGHWVVCYNRRGHHISGAAYDTKASGAYQGVAIKTVPTINGRGLAAVSASFFAAVAAAFSRADVVHIHAEGPAVMCWLPRLMGKRVIVTVHGLDWQREKWSHGLGAKYIHMGERMAVRFAHEIIVLSQGVRQYFLDTYGRQTTFLPNGVSKPQRVPSEELESAWGLETDSYLLFLGRLVPEKGIHRLIEAFRQVNTEKKLVIAGGTSDTDGYVEALRRQGAEDSRVLFTGFVQGKPLEALYSNAYLYVLPSDLEGMPLSLLEAMSYGNCCLVSDIDECAQVVGDCGFTFPKGNTDRLRQQLQFLCDHPGQVNACRERASDYVCNKYSWEDVTEKTLQLYG